MRGWTQLSSLQNNWHERLASQKDESVPKSLKDEEKCKTIKTINIFIPLTPHPSKMIIFLTLPKIFFDREDIRISVHSYVRITIVWFIPSGNAISIC